MARSKAVLGEGARLTDYLSTTLLASVFPAPQVQEVLAEQGVASQRVRSFPAPAVAYYCMALSLYPEAAYESVFAAVTEGLAWRDGAPTPPTVAKSAISQARKRLGWEPMKQLMHRCCQPLAQASSCPQSFYRGLRLMAIDGSNFEICDEALNSEHFGRPGSRTGRAAYPQAQCAILVECGTHAIIDADIGAYRVAEWKVAESLLARLQPGMLCMADRGFVGYEHWRQARASGADLLWRMPKNLILPVLEELPDGSYLSALYPNERDRRAGRNGTTVRVIEYALPKVPGSEPAYRLICSVLDPEQAPALELATLYQQRWEIEGVFDELKTHLQQSRRVLRSKTPDLVRQEFFGWVMAHYAVRWLMHQAARQAQTPPLTLSFTAHVQLLRRAIPHSGAISPSAPQKVVRSAARRRRTAEADE